MPPVFYSLIVPAFNEEALLPRTLAAARAAMAAVDVPGELIVVDNNSRDRTAAIAAGAGARVVFEPVNSIARAHNAGAAAAQGRALVFLDADSLLPAETLRQALANLADPACCGGGALFALDARVGWLAERLLAAFNRTAVQHRFVAGCFTYLTREAFDAIGGYDERLYCSTDFALSRALRRWAGHHGRELRIIADPPVITSARKLERPAQYYLSLAVQTLVPFASRSRLLSWYWYRRLPPPTRAAR